MHIDRVGQLTPHADINAILVGLTEGLTRILGDRLAGFYLTGSLTYGDFDRGGSDIDYLAIMIRELAPDHRAQLKQLHEEIGKSWPEWRERIEGSYITLAMLPHVLPPAAGRPYVNQGAFWEPDPPYGNEWLLNLHVLREWGIALVGPEPRDLIGPIDIEDVRAASKRDLLDERVPTLEDPTAYDDPHIRAYVTLTICRILHRAANDEVASKRVASSWVKTNYGEPWRTLVARAEHWSHGEAMAPAEDVKAFIRFTQQVVGERSTLISSSMSTTACAGKWEPPLDMNGFKPRVDPRNSEKDGEYAPAGEDQGVASTFTAQQVADAFAVAIERVHRGFEGEFSLDAGARIDSRQAQHLAEAILGDQPQDARQAALMKLGAFTPRTDHDVGLGERGSGEESDRLKRTADRSDEERS